MGHVCSIKSKGNKSLEFSQILCAYLAQPQKFSDWAAGFFHASHNFNFCFMLALQSYLAVTHISGATEK